MIDRWGPRGFTASVLVASLPFLCCAPDLCWAKHKSKPAQTSSDPCAAPIGYVQDHINKIKALQKAPVVPKSTVYSALSGDPTSKQTHTVEIAALRDEAEGVNALLRSGGCKAFDIKHELATAAH